MKTIMILGSHIERICNIYSRFKINFTNIKFMYSIIIRVP